MSDEPKKIEFDLSATNAGPKTDAPAPHAPREFRKNKRGPAKRDVRERPKPEYDQKILNIRRVARVASGGRRFNFSVAMVIGNRKGSVGVGTGKAGDTSLAIDKAVRSAKKHMIKVNLNKSMSVPHEAKVKYSSALVFIQPAPGRGLSAGSAVRDVLELAGIKDVNAKIISGSKNKLNIARAAIKALESLTLKQRAKVK
jgi:small subunit ribosomal protein S5